MSIREWAHEGGCSVRTNGLIFQVETKGELEGRSTVPVSVGMAKTVALIVEEDCTVQVLTVKLVPGEVERALVQIIVVDRLEPRAKPEVYEWECFPVIDGEAA